VVTSSPSWVTPANVSARAEEYLLIARYRAELFRTNNVLIPMGCDFNFQNANMKYKNMDKLINYINANSDSVCCASLVRRWSSIC
jgi:hypothetical protein